MPRTGTSLAMGLLSKMGIFTGESRKGKNNPEYFENQLLFDFINHKDHVSAEQVILSLSEGHKKWGMKQPNIVNRWEELKPLIDNPHFVITHRRDLKAQFRSHQKAIRNQSWYSFQQRQIEYYTSVKRIAAGHPEIHFNYEDWMTDKKALQRLADFAGVSVTQEAKDFINPSLKHF